MAALLRCVMMLQRDVPRGVQFYRDGLGLAVNVCTERFAELQSGDVKLTIKQVDGEAPVTTGYTPFLHFDVDDLDATVTRLLSLGANLDGPIKYRPHGKIAALRAPDGQMLGLFEPSALHASTNLPGPSLTVHVGRTAS
eukprot:SM000108S14220  [mRNA]  locus=s108:437043:437946:+ [translate_table: standard]